MTHPPQRAAGVRATTVRQPNQVAAAVPVFAEPPPAGHGVVTDVAVAAAVVLAAKAAKDAIAAPPQDAASATAAALSLVIGAVLKAFDRFLRERRDNLYSLVLTITGDHTSIPNDEMREIMRDEEQREATFAAKSRQRLERDLPAALAAPDRQTAVAALLERERRFAKQREEAIHERLLGRARMAAIRAASPDGAYWRLNPLLDNCPQCKAMAGKVWPWTVLSVYAPPLHGHCACQLYSIDEARRRGWITGRDFRSYDDMPHRDIMEAPVDAHIVGDLDLMEQRFAEAYGPRPVGAEPAPLAPVPQMALFEAASVTYATPPVVTLLPSGVTADTSPPPPAGPEPTEAQVNAAMLVATLRRPPNRRGRSDLAPDFAYDPRGTRGPVRDGDTLVVGPAFFNRPRTAREHIAINHVRALAREARNGQHE